jgi:uncharacterized protein YjbI with pentapeptide repeats
VRPNLLGQLELGAETWNSLREEKREAPDLRGAYLKNRDLRGYSFRSLDLSRIDLTECNLEGCDFTLANLEAARFARATCQDALFMEANAASANFSGANLYAANFSNAELSHATFIDASLSSARFNRCRLYKANFEGAELDEVDFSEAHAQGANFKRSSLIEARLVDTLLDAAYFDEALFGETLIVRTNLSKVDGLNSARHLGPSSVDFRSLAQISDVPTLFLRGCGLSEQFIDYLPSMVGQAIQFYSCFISYSSKDEEFARRLHSDLQAQGVRCWYAPENLKIGDRIRTRIDESIKVFDKLLLVLSRSSIESAWVEKEVETAFEKERRHSESTVLFPIALDTHFLDSSRAWAADIRRLRHVGDFSRWKDHDAYQQAFARLLRDLGGRGVEVNQPDDEFTDEIPF